MRRRRVGCTPVAAGCWERPRLSLRLCCSMRVKMVVVAADSALAPYDITCTTSPPQLSLLAWLRNVHALLQQFLGRVQCSYPLSESSRCTVGACHVMPSTCYIVPSMCHIMTWMQKVSVCAADVALSTVWCILAQMSNALIRFKPSQRHEQQIPYATTQ